MRWKAAVQEAVAADLEQELDRGHAEALKGPNFPVSVLLADIDAVLAEIENEESSGHGGMGSTDTKANR